MTIKIGLPQALCVWFVATILVLQTSFAYDGRSTLAAKTGIRCFAPGTKVLTADGNAKAIENIREGDWVIADDPQDIHPPEKFQVKEVLTNRADHLFSPAK